MRLPGCGSCCGTTSRGCRGTAHREHRCARAGSALLDEHHCAALRAARRASASSDAARAPSRETSSRQTCAAARPARDVCGLRSRGSSRRRLQAQPAAAVRWRALRPPSRPCGRRGGKADRRAIPGRLLRRARAARIRRTLPLLASARCSQRAAAPRHGASPPGRETPSRPPSDRLAS